MKKDKDIRRLILDIRKCKTASEERNVIEKEKASIRADISNTKTSAKTKCLNVSKIIIIDMLGYETAFGTFECIKLANSSNFTEKRIGYLGISCLLSKCPEVLLMCTSMMKKDMNSSVALEVGLALVTAGTLSNPDMLMALQPEILKNFAHKENFIKCKAIGACIALVKACPETIPDVLKQINEPYMESASVVFRSIVVLFIEILQISPNSKEKLLYFVHLVSGFLFRVNQSKGDQNDSVDPITQVYLLRFLSYFAEELSGQSEKNLLEINKSMFGSTKNSIKYQIAELFIKSSNQALNRTGNNILQSFLNNPHSNLKFCGLRICEKVAKINVKKVDLNLDLLSCLSDPNIEIKNLALELSFKFINEENIEKVLKSYLNCLMSVDTSLHQTIVSHISGALAMYSISPVWHLDTVIRVSILAAQVPEQMIHNCINLIREQPQLQDYSAKKLFYAFTSGFRQESLVNLCFWSIGEYPYNIKTAELESFLESLTLISFSITTQMYMANMLFKLAMKNVELRRTAGYLLDHLSFTNDLEVQQRACEYLNILNDPTQIFNNFFDAQKLNLK